MKGSSKIRWLKTAITCLAIAFIPTIAIIATFFCQEEKSFVHQITSVWSPRTHSDHSKNAGPGHQEQFPVDSSKTIAQKGVEITGENVTLR